MGLKRYHDKRNFRMTPEPKGGEAKSPRQGALRFVIQLHDATRKHYDVRLELDGTMKSWAVPKGPSTDPIERRLAVEVEDHPIEYNDFEGIIPAGNYGAGVVMIWDEGTYTARAIDFPAKDENDALRRGLAKGHLTVILSGKKLKGEFALIRLAKGGRANWLMVKKHDRFASRTEVTHDDRSARSGRTMGEIAATANKEGKIWASGKRDRTVATAPKTVGKADKGVKGRNATKIGAHESPKAKDPKSTHGIAKRNDLPPRFRKVARGDDVPKISRPAAWLPATTATPPKDTIVQPLFDGYRSQLLVDDRGRVTLGAKTGGSITKRFPELASALGTLKGPLLLDGLIVALDGEGRPRRRGQGTRQDALRYVFYVYDLLHADGYDLGGLPLTTRLKALAALHIDALSLVDATLPTPSNTERAIGQLARSETAGYGAANAARTYQAGTFTTTKDSAPGDTAAVVAAEARVTGSRHAVIGRTGSPVTAPRLSLSNLTKLYWPDEKLTKGDLLEYYRIVAPYMVPHLVDRPQSLNRHPNGIKGASFFQKEVAGHIPGWMQTATIASGRSGKVVTYALCQNATDLLCLANMGCIEINTWLARVPNVNQPDFVVFDLDPGAIPFEAVIETARVIKKILDAIDAPAFCKTSGGRGLHIYVPIKGATSFDDAREFAETLSREVNRRLPDTTSLERTPSKRTKLIYLDYLQNRVGQTMASVYSARPRVNATVSTPLKWSEVKLGLDPAAFTMATVPKRLAKVGDLWAGILDKAVPIQRCMKSLVALISRENNKK